MKLFLTKQALQKNLGVKFAYYLKSIQGSINRTNVVLLKSTKLFVIFLEGTKTTIHSSVYEKRFHEDA